MLRLALLLASLTIFPFGLGSAQVTFGGSDPGPGDETLRSPRYAVTAAGQPSFVYQTVKRPAGTGPLKEVLLETMAWTTLASDQSVAVEITFLGRTEIAGAIVRPLSLGIIPQVEGNRVRFSLPSSRKVTVEETGHAENPLFILGHPADPAAVAAPAADTIVFPAGVHRLPQDPLVLRSGQTVVLQPGAYVQGRFVGLDVENVRVLGRGTISGTYLARPPMDQVGGYDEKKSLLLLALQGPDCELNGPTLVDGPFWTARLGSPDPQRLYRVAHVAILGWYMNTDGFQEMHHTRAHDLFTCVNDDAFILNNTGNCVVERAVVWGLRAGAPIRLGWNGTDDLSGVVYRDIDVVHFNGHSAISLWHGGPSHVRDILIENVRLEGPMNMLLSLRVAKNPWSPPGRELGRASDITIRQVSAEGPFAKPSEITGTPGHPIERITLENIRLGGRSITSLDQIPLNTNPHAHEITVRSSP